MQNPTISGLAAAIALASPFVVPGVAAAASDADLKLLRAEIAQMKSNYEQQIAALERRLNAAEATAQKAEVSAQKAETTASRAEQIAAVPPVKQPAPPPAANAFNPAISLVLSGMYTHLQNDPNKTPYRIDGFAPSLGEIGPPSRGFNIGESELSLEASIDPMWSGRLTLALPPENGESPEIEEAFIRSSSLPNGFGLTAGRFLSGVGYLNSQHAHTWDFSDAPLPYQAFFGGQLIDDGLQLKWLAPSDIYFSLGAEAMNGMNFPSTNNGKNGVETAAFFANVGGDIGNTQSWRAGASYLTTKPRDRVDDPDIASYAISARTKMLIGDFVYKWKPEDGSGASLKLQGEYMRRHENGDLNYLAGTTNSYDSTQSGWYLQSVYQFLPAWRVGYRYDRLDYGHIDNVDVAAGNIPGLNPYNPSRSTVMFDWSPSEFSRFRVQFARDKARNDITDNQVWLHYIVNLGAHGAHKY